MKLRSITQQYFNVVIVPVGLAAFFIIGRLAEGADDVSTLKSREQTIAWLISRFDLWGVTASTGHMLGNQATQSKYELSFNDPDFITYKTLATEYFNSGGTQLHEHVDKASLSDFTDVSVANYSMPDDHSKECCKVFLNAKQPLVNSTYMRHGSTGEELMRTSDTSTCIIILFHDIDGGKRFANVAANAIYLSTGKPVPVSINPAPMAKPPPPKPLPEPFESTQEYGTLKNTLDDASEKLNDVNSKLRTAQNQLDRAESNGSSTVPSRRNIVEFWEKQQKQAQDKVDSLNIDMGASRLRYKATHPR